MSFVDHLEALRWHIVRSVLAIVIIAIVLFIKMSWVFDKVIMGTIEKGFYQLYRALRPGKETSHGRCIVHAPGKHQDADYYFQLAVHIQHHDRICWRLYRCFSIYFLGILALSQTSPFA